MDTSWSSIGLWTFLAFCYWLLGVAAGWWLKDRRASLAALAAEKTRHYLSRLHELTTLLADDVAKHVSRMEEISHDILHPEPHRGASAESLLLDAVSQVVIANKRLHTRLNSAEHQLQLEAQEIGQHLLEIRADEVTGLPNRRVYEEKVQEFLQLRRTENRAVSVLIVDLDSFQQFNEQHGSAQGNRMLRKVAQAIQATVRERDIATRFGGEEFAIVLPDTSMPDAMRAAERVRLAIENIVDRVDEREFRITASVGAAEATTHDTVRLLHRRADAALYAAKEAGRNRSFFHDNKACHPVLEDASMSTLVAAKQDTSALHNRALVYAQYVAALGVDARTDVLTGLPNRRAFGDELRRRMADAARKQESLTLMLVGVDHLNRLAAFHGQDAVDQVLRKIAQVLCAVIRDADLVTRYGWEEFAVILSGTTYDDARRAHDRVQSALEACLIEPDRVTISTGLAELAEGEDPAQLAKRAEQALQKAKSSGGNRSEIAEAAEEAVAS